MQRACALLSSVACPALQHLSKLSYKQYVFRKTVIENERCVLIFSAIFFGNIFHSKDNRAVYDQKCKLVFV